MMLSSLGAERRLIVAEAARRVCAPLVSCAQVASLSAPTTGPRVLEIPLPGEPPARPLVPPFGDPLNSVIDSLCDTQVRMKLALCTAAAQVRLSPASA